MPKAEKPEIMATIETVTPTKAERWLGRNSRNRHEKPRRIARYATAMRRGEWELNGEAIKFDSNGHLLDGQNRLRAVVESGVTIKSLVIHNLPPETQDTMDDVSPRSLKDALAIRKIDNATDLATAIAWLHRWETGTLRNFASRPSVREGLDLYARHPNLGASIPQARALGRRLMGPRGMYTYLHYRFASLDPDDADDFFEQLTTGEALRNGSPIYALRRTLEANITATKKMTDTYRLAYFIKAWNAYRLGEDVKVLSWRGGGTKAEKLPEPT